MYFTKVNFEESEKYRICTLRNVTLKSGEKCREAKIQVLFKTFGIIMRNFMTSAFHHLLFRVGVQRNCENTHRETPDTKPYRETSDTNLTMRRLTQNLTVRRLTKTSPWDAWHKTSPWDVWYKTSPWDAWQKTSPWDAWHKNLPWDAWQKPHCETPYTKPHSETPDTKPHREKPNKITVLIYHEKSGLTSNTVTG